MHRPRRDKGPLCETVTVHSPSDLLSTVREARRRLADTGPERIRVEGDFARVSLPDLDCDVLRDLLIAEGARVVIEIGLAYGSSALAIGEALLSQGPRAPLRTRHVIIDPHQNLFHDAGWKAMLSAGLGGVSSLLAERSQIALPRLVTEGFVSDAAFVDGSHIFHHVFVDLAFLHELVKPGGMIILDDCQYPSVASAVRYFEVNTGWRHQAVPTPTRLSVFRVPNPRVEPTFEKFTAFSIDSTP